MAAALTVPSYKVWMRATVMVGGQDNLPPHDELARMAGERYEALTLDHMPRKVAVKLLGGLAVDKLMPHLAEHVQAMKGNKDAQLHDDFEFADLKEARKHQRDLIKLHGTEQLEAALR